MIFKRSTPTYINLTLHHKLKVNLYDKVGV